MNEILIGIYILFGVIAASYWLYVDTYKKLGRILIIEFPVALFVGAIWPSYVIVKILELKILEPILFYKIIKKK